MSGIASAPRKEAPEFHGRVPGWLAALLGAATTGLMATLAASHTAPESDRIVIAGAAASVAVSLLLAACGANRATTRRLRFITEARRQHALLITDALPSAPAPGARRALVRSLTAIIVLVTGCAATLLLREGETGWLPHAGPPLLIAGGVATALIWSLVFAAIVHARRAERAASELRSTRSGALFSAELFDAMPIPMSIALAEGSRIRFNAKFRSLSGRSDDALAGRGWLSSLEEADRTRYERFFASPPPPSSEPVQFEHGLRDVTGQTRWIHETLVPLLSGGAVAGYLISGIDVTKQVKNERELQQAAEKLRGELDAARASGREEVAALRDRLDEQEEARDQMRRDLDSAQSAAESAKEKLADARQKAQKGATELKAMAAEQREMKAEHRKLSRANEKLQEIIDRAEAEERARRDEREGDAQQVRALRSELDEARRQESQLRARVDALAERSQQLEMESAQARAARAEALDDASGAHAAIEADRRRRHADLAGVLRAEIDAVREAAERLAESVSGEVAVRSVDEARASIAALSALVGGASGEADDESPRLAEARSFDLRAAVRSTCLHSEKAAAARNVTLRCVIDEEFTSEVAGDPIAMRHVLAQLLTTTLALVDDGILTVRLSAAGTTMTHVCARVEIRHDIARIDRGELEARLSAQTSPSEIEDVVGEADRYRSAVAWSLIRSMGGEYGIDRPAEGGFIVWFAVTLPKGQMAENAPRAQAQAQEIGQSHSGAPIANAVAARPAGRRIGVVKEIPAPVPDDAAPAAHRVPRLPQELLESSLGEVTELGCESLRVTSTSALSGRVQVVLPDGKETLALDALVESSERLARRKHDVILRFLDPMPQTRQRILQIAMSHRRRSDLPINSIATG